MAQQSGLIVSVSGIRGIVGQGLTPEAALAFAAALGTATGGGRIVLSRDGRPSGAMLRHAVLAGLLGAGCEVQDLGVTPTPTCGLAVRRLQAAGGIQITASHNPAEWNGLKLFGPEGRVLPAAEGHKIKERFESGTFRHVPWQELGTLAECRQALDWHRDRVLELVDVPRIRARQLKTLVDANGGAGGPLARKLLEALQANPVCHACDADGSFLHEPEPVAGNLRAIGPLVPEHGADIGFVLDPDADRLALIDETGRYIGEELTLALAVRYRLTHERGPVVINMSTSRVNEDIARQFGCPCHRTAVGEANVVDKMRDAAAVIGGEGNGGVIDPRVGWVRDPFIGMGLILNLLAESGKKLSDLVAGLPAYSIVKDKVTIDRDRLPSLFAALTKHWPEARVDRLDGLRLDWSDRWVHVRPSNTEPIVRVIAEAPQQAAAEQLCRETGNLLK
ncbi:MAG: phosphoglucosamine mutase [Planctomycetota bacterium]|nr:MAG: phosphoglucosamine mutase [Planctomycetota bacterium]HMC66362.1 phosphoglucosamine mutase [Gemmataceae bacterium]